MMVRSNGKTNSPLAIVTREKRQLGENGAPAGKGEMGHPDAGDAPNGRMKEPIVTSRRHVMTSAAA